MNKVGRFFLGVLQKGLALTLFVAIIAGVGFLGFGKQIQAAFADESVWQAKVVAKSVSDGSVIFDTTITTRTEFKATDYPKLCNAPFTISSDQPLMADGDFEVTVDGTKHGFSEDFAVAAGQTNWEVTHTQNACAISLWNPAEPQAPEQVVSNAPAASNTPVPTPEPWKAHVLITDTVTNEKLFEGDILGRTPFYQTDYPWTCRPITVVSDKPLKGDSDLTNTVNGEGFGFAEAWHLKKDVANTLDVEHSTNCTFTLQEESLLYLQLHP